jgi:hypothetical protein
MVKIPARTDTSCPSGGPHVYDCSLGIQDGVRGTFGACQNAGCTTVKFWPAPSSDNGWNARGFRGGRPATKETT